MDAYLSLRFFRDLVSEKRRKLLIEIGSIPADAEELSHAIEKRIIDNIANDSDLYTKFVIELMKAISTDDKFDSASKLTLKEILVFTDKQLESVQETQRQITKVETDILELQKHIEGMIK